MALTVDTVSDALTMPHTDIEPRNSGTSNMELVLAVGKHEDRALLILDPSTLTPAS
jgi:chemotaxis signal transduction protein